MSKHYNTYLALGDSYTIGEGLPLHDSFPYQLVQILRNKGHHFNAPEIVAKTGWTTFELAEHILHNQLNEKYDFVTLLIGVNNQYRNLLADYYKNDFEFLIKKAIHFSSEHPERVIVLSIPDWGVTPFAKGRDREKIRTEIDQFNKINKELTDKYGAVYLDITKTSREAANDAGLLGDDKLHPSEKQYAIWVIEIADAMEKNLAK
jgi:lysophospholipase L1-like esterase